MEEAGRSIGNLVGVLFGVFAIVVLAIAACKILYRAVKWVAVKFGYPKET